MQERVRRQKVIILSTRCNQQAFLHSHTQFLEENDSAVVCKIFFADTQGASDRH